MLREKIKCEERKKKKEQMNREELKSKLKESDAEKKVFWL